MPTDRINPRRLAEGALRRAWTDASQLGGRAFGVVWQLVWSGIGTWLFAEREWLDKAGTYVVGAVAGFLVGLMLLVTLALARALVRQRNEARQRVSGLEGERDARRPALQVSEPLARPVPTDWRDDGRPSRFAEFVYVPVRNEPETDEGGVAAEDVHAQIRVLPWGDATASKWMPARWWKLSPQEERFTGSWAPENEVAETRLPANGRDFFLDVVAQFEGNDFCTISNQETTYEIGASGSFFVELMLQGSNFPAKRFQIEITPAELKDGRIGVPRTRLVHE